MTTKQLYKHALKAHALDHCWACGRTGYAPDRPQAWWGAWWIERAHIVRSPRVEDIRAICHLCSLCHRAGVHGERIITPDRPVQYPRLEVAHLIGLKLLRDPENFSLPFLQQHNVKRLPAARELPIEYVTEYAGRHGE